jgi:hypothetical protein
MEEARGEEDAGEDPTRLVIFRMSASVVEETAPKAEDDVEWAVMYRLRSRWWEFWLRVGRAKSDAAWVVHSSFG